MNALVKHLQDIGRVDPRRVAASHLGDDVVGERIKSEQAAYERGAAEALMRAGAVIEQALVAADQSIAGIQAQWTVECQERICREAAEGRSLIEERLSEELLRAISPFVEARQIERIRESFLKHLREVLPTKRETPIKIAGPADERKIMVDCLGEMGIVAMYHDHDARVIEAEIGPHIIRADFTSWSRRWLGEFGDGLDVGR